MRKIALIAFVFAIAAFLGSRSSQAYYDAPWCAVATLSPGGVVERCEFRDLESCRIEVIAGNRGFCRQNVYWSGEPTLEMRKARKRSH